MFGFSHHYSSLVSRTLNLIVVVLVNGGAQGATTPAADGAGPATGGYLIDVWDSNRGLPENSVVSLAQTPDGYLWLGTLQAGVARFDGVRFTAFDPANTPALPRVDIQRLLVDTQGVLWIAMIGGSLARLEAGRFTLESGLSLSGRDAVTALVVSRTNEVIFGTRLSGLIRGVRRPGTNSSWERIRLPSTSLPPCCGAAGDGRIWYRRGDQRLGCWRDGKVEPMQTYEGLRGQQVMALATDARGRIWVGTERGLACFEGGAFVDMTPTNGEPDVAVQDCVFGGDDGLWVRSEGRLRKCVGRQWIAEAKGWSEVPIPGTQDTADLHGDREGGVWFRHRHEGIWHVQPGGGMEHLSDKNGLPNGLIACWLQDREENVWLGLEGGGLVRLRPRHFNLLRRPDVATGAVVRSVCEDATGGVWWGGSDGKIFHWQAGSIEEVALPQNRVPNRDVTLCPDRDDGIWVGTVQNGVWRWNDGRMRRPILSRSIGTVVRALIEDSRGRMWLGNEFGFYCWSEGALRHFGPEQGFPNEYVLSLAEDPAGGIWIGTARGHLWRLKDDQLTPFALPPSAPSFRFWSLLADAQGSVWVGTLGGGLLRWRHGQLTRCTSADGLPSDTISQLLEDDRGNLWAGSRAGIFSVNRDALNAFLDGAARRVFCRSFGTSDGLPALECSAGYQPACWHGRDGRLWFATVKGVVSLQPGELPANSLPPLVVIEGVRVDGAAQEIPPANPGLTLSPGRHYVEFRFTGLSLTAPERVRFQWRLEGLERDWVDGGNQRAVSYSYLPPGHYAFEVRACNSDGIWNEAGATLGFAVLPEVWQTWWFRLFAPILAFALIGGTLLRTVRRRHRLQLERLRQQRALEQERTRIAQDLHDDLGASLTQVAWLGEAASRAGTSPEEHYSLVAQITAKSRDMVRAIDEIVWAVNPKNDSLDHLVTYVCDYAEQFFRGTPIRCWMDVPELLPAHRLPSDMRHHLFLTVKEALHNVAKHAGASQVWVRVKIDREELRFVIEDNGQGFVAAGKAAGDGLENMRQRAAAIGMSFTLQSVPGRGTIISMGLPLARGALVLKNHPQG